MGLEMSILTRSSPHYPLAERPRSATCAAGAARPRSATARGGFPKENERKLRKKKKKGKKIIEKNPTFFTQFAPVTALALAPRPGARLGLEAAARCLAAAVWCALVFL